MRQLLVATLLLALVSTAAIADGPETGVVTGKVVDAQGQPLPGVTVSLQGERGTQTAITDNAGSYRFALLAPGGYALRAELEGFRVAEGVTTVTAGGKVDVELKLVLETAETITVTSEAPMVDKFNVTAGSTITSEIGAQTSGETRNYYGVINLLPGVTSDADNGDIQGTRPSVNGSHFADNSVYIDGVDTTFARLGGSRVFLPTTATTEITMEAGGSSAEYGRVVGSSTNVIVKSGTNKLHGDLAGQYSTTEWSADYKDQVVLEQRETAAEPRSFLRRLPGEEDGDTSGFEFSLGGPLKRDRAWFFIGWADFDSNNRDKTLNGDIIDVSLDNESRIAKFNFQPASSHQLSVSWIDTPARRIYFHPPSGDRFTPTPHDLSGDLGSLNWNWSASSDLFLETKLATQSSDENKFLAASDNTNVAEAIRIKQQDPRFPGISGLAETCAFGRGDPRCHLPGNNYGVYLDNEDNSSWHNGWILDNGFGINEYPRQQANAAATWFASNNHEFRFGIDWQEVEWNSDVARTQLYTGDNFNALSHTGFGDGVEGGPNDCGFWNGHFCFFRDYNPADLVAQGKGSGDTSNINTALYVRDRFTAGDHWIFNIGVRAEQQRNKNDVDRLVVDAVEVAPRFSGTLDVKADGRMLVSLNAGRYYAHLNQQFTNEWLQEEWNGYFGYDDFLYCSAVDAALGIAGCQFFGVGYTFPFRQIRPGRQFELADQGFFDIDLDPYYKDEAILGFEWQFTSNWALDTKAIYWELGDMIGNTLQRDPDGSFFFLSANYKDYADLLGSLGQVPQPILDSFEEGRKEYRAIQLQLNRRFSNGWAVYNNLTIGELETTGSGAWWNNTNSTYGEDLGEVLTQTHIDNCAEQQVNRTVPVDCQALLGPHLGQPLGVINRFGNDGLQGDTGGSFGSGVDRPYVWKTFGFKTFELGGSHTLNVGGLFGIQDGIAWGRGESLEITPPGDGNTALQSQVFVPLEANGTRRLGGHYWLNLSAAYGFPLGNDLRGEVRIEGTNITNQQRQVNVNSRGEADRVRREFQRPRQFRLLASFSF